MKRAFFAVFVVVTLGLSLAPASQAQEPKRIRISESPEGPSFIPRDVLETPGMVLMKLRDGSYLASVQDQEAAARGENRFKVLWPPAAAEHAPRGFVVTDAGMVPPMEGYLPPMAGEAEDDADHLPETIAWKQHVRALETQRNGQGPDVGGSARMGIRLGGKSERTQLEPEVAAGLESWNGSGALCINVVPGSPAERAGLIAGDVVVQYAGLWIDNWQTLLRMATRSEKGREYEVKFLRDGEVQSTFVIPVDESELNPR